MMLWRNGDSISSFLLFCIAALASTRGYRACGTTLNVMNQWTIDWSQRRRLPYRSDGSRGEMSHQRDAVLQPWRFIVDLLDAPPVVRSRAYRDHVLSRG
jgi:hypothetical protein